MFKEKNQNEVFPGASQPRFADDYAFAQQLICGEDRAWEYFSQEFRKKIKDHTAKKYSNVLGDVEIEEICDGVEKRVMVNDDTGKDHERGMHKGIWSDQRYREP